jgi:hypothetical protein
VKSTSRSPNLERTSLLKRERIAPEFAAAVVVEEEAEEEVVPEALLSDIPIQETTTTTTPNQPEALTTTITTITTTTTPFKVDLVVPLLADSVEAVVVVVDVASTDAVVVPVEIRAILRAVVLEGITTLALPLEDPIPMEAEENASGET